ncbi:trypsin-like serine peptidase [Xinfangfangia pollutisoli]|uniref:trypsin-like serine peptidase n=1 Tax=Xinfangfangia pollutisoli TaxID=2865960 RepID=UPI001CD239C9|nr:trypsin-like peptidase domain-containing protein [Xinfangfangia pollutisoli]
MIRPFLVLVALVALPLMAPAQTGEIAETGSGGLVAMRTGDAVKGWESVGKLILGKRGFCTGALIAPDRVLTAAHCLYDKETGARTPDSLITFQAGWRDGRAEAYRGIRRSAIDPDYVYTGADEMERVAHDVAVLELDQPILLPQLAPFGTDMRPGTGDAVSVVSYAQGREETPSIEQGCAVLAARASAMILSCDIDFGSSGAPVFTVQDGVARVVSVISAKAEYDGRKVALAVPLDHPLAVALAELERTPGGQKSVSGVRVLKGGDAASSGGGAKFVTP